MFIKIAKKLTNYLTEQGNHVLINRAHNLTDSWARCWPGRRSSRRWRTTSSWRGWRRGTGGTASTAKSCSAPYPSRGRRTSWYVASRVYFWWFDQEMWLIWNQYSDSDPVLLIEMSCSLCFSTFSTNKWKIYRFRRFWDNSRCLYCTKVMRKGVKSTWRAKIQKSSLYYEGPGAKYFYQCQFLQCCLILEVLSILDFILRVSFQNEETGSLAGNSNIRS